jgi:hypothetical protein
MRSSWKGFFDELALWRDLGRSVDFWWRDDDATTRTASLDRLVALAGSAQVPLALAVIPQDADADLLSGDQGAVTVLQHGVGHRNAAGPGEKKTEFAVGESAGAAAARLQWGRRRLQDLYGARSMPVLVPPWNRISQPGLVAGLAGSGYLGLSRFGPRVLATLSPGLVQVNTHVDVIDWKGRRGFVGEDAALKQAVTHLQARRFGTADTDEATGWLTHHAVHDEPTWAFLQELFQLAGARSNVVWRSATELFLRR